MEGVNLCNQITSIEQIIRNSSNDITSIDIISLIFHCTISMAKTDSGWNKFYSEFITDFENQNKNKWPELIIIKNDFSKRTDAICITSFIDSKNLLTILQRILYIEQYKIKYVCDTYQYHPVLSHKINLNVYFNIKKMSINNLFDLLKICMTDYLKIYNDDEKIENLLAKNILKQIS